MLQKFATWAISFSFTAMCSWICQLAKLDKIYKFYHGIIESQSYFLQAQNKLSYGEAQVSRDTNKGNPNWKKRHHLWCQWYNFIWWKLQKPQQKYWLKIKRFNQWQNIDWYAEAALFCSKQWKSKNNQEGISISNNYKKTLHIPKVIQPKRLKTFTGDKYNHPWKKLEKHKKKHTLFCSSIVINTVKCTLPKWCIFNVITIKISVTFFINLKKQKKLL